MEALQVSSDAPPPAPPTGAAPPETWDATKMDPDVIGMSAAMEAMEMMSAEPGMEGLMAPVPAPEEDKPAPVVVETPQIPVEAKVEAPKEEDEDEARAPPSIVESITGLLGAGAGSSPQEKLVRLFSFGFTTRPLSLNRLVVTGRSCSCASC